MKLIKPSFEIIDQETGLNGMLKHIELCGRVCYKSEDKITEDSSERFVDNLVKSGHTSVLEHGTVYLMIDCSGRLIDVADKYVHNKYSTWVLHEDGRHYCITSNFRVLVENKWMEDLKYICNPTKYHDKRISVRFICDRGISHELTRHRVFSFSQESTRYCNYSKDKFKREITCIVPPWANINEGFTMTAEYHCSGDADFNSSYLDSFADDSFARALAFSELIYFDLLTNGWAPQQARAVLPNALKTEIIMTGFIKDWEHFFKLRCHTTAHPQMRELAIPLRDEFIKRGYIKEEI